MSKATIGDANIDTDALEPTTDPFRFEDFNRSELAIDVIATMLGFNTQDRLEEKHKPNADGSRLAELEKQQDALLDEQELIYSGNKETMAACIAKYSPIIRARYEAK